VKFSLAIVDGKRKLCSTQAEAKDLDPKFSRFDVPTGHDDLKAFVQDLFDQIDGATPADQEGDEGHSNDGVGAKHPLSPSTPDPKWKGNLAAVKAGEVCPACARTPKGSKLMAGVLAMSEIEEAVETLTESRQLVGVLEAVKRRRDELSRQATARLDR